MSKNIGNWPVIKPDDRRLFISEPERTSSSWARVSAFFVDLKFLPKADAGLDTQILHGHSVRVLEQKGEWTKIASQLTGKNGETKDHYVGWVLSSGISSDTPAPTHRVIAPRTFLYPEADMKKPRSGYRSMGSLITVVGHLETRGTAYGILSDGNAVIDRHISPLTETSGDYVAVAEQLLATPYLWGGNTGFGIDCSGLVQLSMEMAGKAVFRDTDMQAATIGAPVDIKGDWSDLQRGDLIFWRGHVAIAQGYKSGEAHLIHANGYTMDVTSEPVQQAVDRIAYLYEMPIGVRRP
ncbi:MAG: NlpC/P60 family protein [Salaquimonas sp.]